MKFLSFLSYVLFAYSAAASVVFRSIEASRDVSASVRDPVRRDPRQETPRYSKIFAANTLITTGSKYAFMLTWDNNEGYYASAELKDYCKRLGFKHKAVMVGYVHGSDRTIWDFTGHIFDLWKNAGDKGISVKEDPVVWAPGLENVAFLGEIRSSLKPREIAALGEFALQVHTFSHTIGETHTRSTR